MTVSLQVTLNPSVSVQVLPHGFLCRALDILEVAQQLSFLEKYSLLEWATQFIQDVLHTIFAIDALEVKVFGL